MSDPSSAGNLFDLLTTAESQPTSEATGSTLTPWRATWSVLAVHSMELEQQGVIDEAGLATIARALDSVYLHDAKPGIPLPVHLANLEQRIDAMLPAEFSGVATLGLAREDCQATAVRLLWLDASDRASAGLDGFRAELVAMSESHSMTLMPAMIAGRPAQPTMMGHFLGGVVSPLTSAARRFELARKDLARSPLGSGLMSGEMIAVDRERAAKGLGFSDVAANTFDAVANVEDFVAILEAFASGLAPVARMLREFASWIRTSPNSLVLSDDWELRPEPTVPSLRLGQPLLVLIDSIEEVQRQLALAVVRLRSADYAPLGHLQSVLAEYSSTLIVDVEAVLEEATAFIANGMLINRAYLGNRAGRGYTTAGDLASYLMTEEQLPPSAARGIASIVAGNLSEQSLETNAVTQEMIDSAALMLIGREIKVEIETLGRYLAPRRFIERRQVTGSAAGDQLRAWLTSERDALGSAARPPSIVAALDTVRNEIGRIASLNQD